MYVLILPPIAVIQVRCGVAHRYIAGSIFEDLMVELKQLTSVPVLIAVDQYNTWEVDSAFSIAVSERKSTRIPGFDLCVPRGIYFLLAFIVNSICCISKSNCMCDNTLTYALSGLLLCM